MILIEHAVRFSISLFVWGLLNARMLLSIENGKSIGLYTNQDFLVNQKEQFKQP